MVVSARPASYTVAESCTYRPLRTTAPAPIFLSLSCPSHAAAIPWRQDRRVTGRASPGHDRSTQSDWEPLTGIIGRPASAAHLGAGATRSSTFPILKAAVSRSSSSQRQGRHPPQSLCAQNLIQGRGKSDQIEITEQANRFLLELQLEQVRSTVDGSVNSSSETAA